MLICNTNGMLPDNLTVNRLTNNFNNQIKVGLNFGLTPYRQRDKHIYLSLSFFLSI